MIAVPTHYEKYLRQKGLPVINSASKTAPMGLYDQNVFGVTEEERFSKAALINLNCYVIRPNVFSILRQVNRNITGCCTTKNEYCLRDGQLIPVDEKFEPGIDDIIGSGPRFVYDIWDKIDKKAWVKETGRYINKEMKKSFQKYLREQVFQHYVYVIPIGMRAEDDDSALIVNDWNLLYADIIRYSQALADISQAQSAVGNIQTRDLEILIQQSVVALGTYIQERILSPKGLARKSVMSRSVDNCSRLVALPNTWNNDKLGVGKVRTGYIGLPVHTVANMYKDTTLKFAKDFIMALFDLGKFDSDVSQDMMAFYDSEFLADATSKLSDPFFKVQPFPAIKMNDEEFGTIKLTFEVSDPNKLDEVESIEKDLTWLEFFYIVLNSYCNVSKTRGVATTRYPVDSQLSLQFLKPVTTSLLPNLLKTVNLPELHFRYEDDFPFVDDYVKNNYHLKIFETGNRALASTMVGFNGDHDGDQISNMPIDSDEGVADVNRIQNSLFFTFDYVGNFRRSAGKDADQTFYSFSRDAKSHEKPKTIKEDHPLIKAIMDAEDGQIDTKILYQYLSSYEENEPEVNIYDKVTIKRLGKPITTTVGRLIINKIVFARMWDKKGFDFFDGVYTKKKMNDRVRLIGQLVVEDQATVDDLNHVVDMICEFGLRLSTIFNASVTINMIIPDGNFMKSRDNILNPAFDEYSKNKDVSSIEKAEKDVMDMAKEYYKDDDMMEIYESGASADLGNDWKTMNVSMGSLPSLDGKSEVMVQNGLSDGIPLSMTAELTNTAMKGAVDRGSKTALAGDLYKQISNGMSNVSGYIGDCGSTEGVATQSDNKWDILNRYALVNGKPVLITLDNVDNFLGKKFLMRSPIHCKAKNGDFCSTCVGIYPFKARGDKAGKLHIGIYVAEMASGILNMFMKSTHDLHMTSFNIDDLNKYIYPAGSKLFEKKEDPVDGIMKIFCLEDIEWRIPSPSVTPVYNYYEVLAHGSIVSSKGKDYTIVLGTEVMTIPTEIMSTDKLEEDEGLEKHTIFRYKKGDAFLIQCSSFKKPMTTYKMFNAFLTGTMSHLVPLKYHLDTLNNSMKANKSISSSQLSTDLILATIARDVNDLEKPVRETGGKEYRFISVYEVGATSGMFNAVFSNHAAKAIFVNMAKSESDQSKKVSPLEKALRY